MVEIDGDPDTLLKADLAHHLRHGVVERLRRRPAGHLLRRLNHAHLAVERHLQQAGMHLPTLALEQHPLQTAILVTSRHHMYQLLGHIHRLRSATSLRAVIYHLDPF